MLLSLTEFIGRFHPLLVHFPIGILLLALLLQWISKKENYNLPNNVMKLIWGIGFAGALLSCISGYLLSTSGEYEDTTAALHMWMGIGVAAVSLFLFAKVSAGVFDSGFKIFCIVLTALILFTGHLGGTLTHGAGYLTGTSNEEEMVPQKLVTNAQEAAVYQDIVQPMFQAKCYSCHGPKKQKGKLRLDKPDLIMKGGEDGAVLVQGNADESEMIKRILLPREDEDHMPPKQKPQLKEQQVALLHWWISNGADFSKKVKELPQDEKIKKYLTDLERPQIKQPTIAIIPNGEVEKASDKDLEVLKKENVALMAVAQNSNYLAANFVNRPDAGDKEVSLLLPFKKQLVWLKLGNTRITDEALKHISEFTKLTFLQLNATNISDKGLAYLKSLEQLQSLNLVNTNITAQGLMELKNLKNLQSIYLYHSKVDTNALQALKKIFPKTNLDLGGYLVPSLPTDTMLVQPKKSK